MRRKLSQGIAVAAVAITITGGVAGCGVVNKLDAKQKVSKAFESFEGADSATFTMKLNTTASDVAAIAKADGDPLTAEDKKIFGKVVAGDVQYSMHAPDGKKLGDSADASKQIPDVNSLLQDPQKFANYLKQAGDIALAVHLEGDSLVEIRFRDGVIYARAAVPKIMDLAGEDPSQIDSALADLPASLAPIKKAAKGEWVSVDLTSLMQTLKESGALDELNSAAASAPTPSINAGAVQKLMNDLKAAYRDKVTIKEIGDSDRGTEYQLSASGKQVAAAVQDDIIAIVGDAAATDVKDGIAQIPDKPINVSVWVKGDELSGMALDLTQFLDNKPANAKLALDVAIDMNSGDIEVPAGATALDVKALMDEFQSQMSGGYGGSGSFDDSEYGQGGSSSGGGSTEPTLPDDF